MLKKYFATFCLLSIAEALIALPPGYKLVRKHWPQFVNQSKTKVQEEISRIFPNVPFKVFDKIDGYITEEFYFNRIKLTVDYKGTVIKTPEFFGSEPDLDILKPFINLPVGKAMAVIIIRFPELKVIVRSIETTKIVWELSKKSKDYILLRVSEDGIMRVEPEYKRG